jgi:hypothetical protein
MSKSYWLEDEGQSGNFSQQKQDSFDPGKGYTGIRLQKGVPLLDRDWNELEDIRRYAEVMLRKHYIGNGTPDDGFKIDALDEAANDFKISSGRCLVQGFEAVNEPEAMDAGGGPAGFLFYSQQPGVEPLTAPAEERTDTVYLDVWIEEVTSEQDEALKNPKDVRMETCIRHKLCWRVAVDEGGKGYTEKPLHYYYPLARLLRGASEYAIKDSGITDLRRTGLAMLSGEITVKNGNVGIGTTEPGEMLDMGGHISCRGYEIQDAVLRNYFRRLVTVADGDAYYELDLSRGNVFNVMLTRDCSLVFKIPPLEDCAGSFTLILKNPGGFEVTWLEPVLWPDGVLPEMKGVTIFNFVTLDAGATWYGYTRGANFMKLKPIFDIVIASNTTNYNMRAAAIQAGWDGVQPSIVNITVNEGVLVGSTGTGSPAMESGDLTNAVATLINNGTILGKGGRGGTGGEYVIVGGAAQGEKGEDGGAALSISSYMKVINNGKIHGGGGGGGGGGSAEESGANLGGMGIPNSYTSGGGGGGGGGGYTDTTGGNGGRAQIIIGQCENGAAGGTGNSSNGGAGGIGGTTVGTTGGSGGNGGAPGCDGTNGNDGKFSTEGKLYPGGNGGAAGYSVVGNRFVTWIIHGFLGTKIS